MLCSSQLQNLQVSPALTLAQVALVPLYQEVAQEVLDPGGSHREQKVHEPPRPGGGLGCGAEFAPEGLNREH